MKIFDAQGKLIHDLPSKPRNFDGWAKGNQFGVEDGDGNRVVFGTCSDIDRARYQLKQVFRAYVDGAETYTVKED